MGLGPILQAADMGMVILEPESAGQRPQRPDGLGRHRVAGALVQQLVHLLVEMHETHAVAVAGRLQHLAGDGTAPLPFGGKRVTGGAPGDEAFQLAPHVQHVELKLHVHFGDHDPA
ncbi:hypothetical protein TSA6c_16035 [Azospirillum sp. TSA6c]|nr:hypothetical protein TSA6c_16035 [Azospirillum sp. TSA6c]